VLAIVPIEGIEPPPEDNESTVLPLYDIGIYNTIIINNYILYNDFFLKIFYWHKIMYCRDN
jgi:hypothetical protein